MVLTPLRFMSRSCVALLLSASFSLMGATGLVSVARADEVDQFPDHLVWHFYVPEEVKSPSAGSPRPFYDPWDDNRTPGDFIRSSTPPLATQAPLSAELQSINRLDNTGATLQLGEPTIGGRMHATGWAHVEVETPSRVVLQTFGSEIDTVLAAYTGPPRFNALKLVRWNDNRNVPGIGTNQSLIAFKAAANVPYSVQFGGRTASTGDILFNTSVLQAAGGLSAFRIQINGFWYPVGDYVCGYQVPSLGPCSPPEFLLYNSTDAAMVVTSSSNLGPGVIAPAPVTIAPGGMKTVEFLFGSGFDTTTVRTVTGHFIFTGRAAAKVVGIARHRALIVVKPTGSPPDVLQVRINPRVRAGMLNEQLPFKVYFGNKGTEAAIGCAIRGNFNHAVRVEWQEIDPETGRTTGAPNTPVTIQGKRSRLFVVVVAGQEIRLS